MDTAVNLILAGDIPPVPAHATAAAGKSASAPVLARETSDGLKMVILVRSDLNMGPGKIAAQCCHAALKAARRIAAAADSAQKAAVAQWQATGEAIVVLRCTGLEDMTTLASLAEACGLPVAGIADAGRTQVSPGTRTVVAIGPAEASRIDAMTGHLKLL
jgi:PTH2 family peptidyl-tRNA hydrolase